MSRMPWPVVLEHGDVRLRPLRRSDERVWRALRIANGEWLAPWDATSPERSGPEQSFRMYVKSQLREARAGVCMPMVIEHEGRFVGQLTLSGAVYGSFRSAYLGYWIAKSAAGRGITTTAVAMLTDFALASGYLHRIEINVRPENSASLRLVEKLGFRSEGHRPRYLHIAGEWRDHLSFCMLADELPAGGLSSLRPLQH